MAAAKKVAMYDPTEDRVVQVDPGEVKLNQELGLELETPETAAQRDYQSRAGLGEALTATGEGLASGATLGLSDVAAGLLGGEEYTKERRLRDETFGGLNTVGQVVGGIAPLLLSGGESALAKGAGMLPTSLAARAAGATEGLVGRGLAALGSAGEKGALRSGLEGALKFGAAGAVEGGISGAGYALSEAALNDELGGADSVAERAWAGAKSGALLGLVGGGVLGGAAGAAGPLAKGISRRFAASGDELAEQANERAWKALDPRANQTAKLTPDKIQQIGEDLRTYELRDGQKVLDWTDKAETLAPKVARAKAEVTEELGALRRRVADQGDDVSEAARSYLRRVDDEVLKPLLESSSPTIRRQGKRAANELQGLRERLEAPSIPVRTPEGLEYRPRAGITYNDLLDQQRALKAVVYPKKAPGAGLTVAADWAEHLARSERILEDEMEGVVERTLAKIAPSDVGRYKDYRRLSESFIKADSVLKKSVGQNLGNRATSLTDYLTGLGTGGAILASGHPVGAVAGLAATAVHKLARERGSAFLATLYTRAKSVDSRVGKGLAGFFVKARERANAATIGALGSVSGEATAIDTGRILRAAHGESHADAYNRVIARANDIVSGRAGGPFMVDEAAPRVGQQMRAVQLRAAQHLVAHAPVPPRTSSNPNLAKLAGDRKPDAVALYEFTRRVRAIDDPLTLMDDLKDGTVSMAAAQAVREVYPRLYADMQARVLESLGNTKELLPYEERIRLGVLFQIPTDPSLRPENLAISQSIYVMQNKPPGMPAPQPGPSKRAQELETPSQQMETGDMPV